MWKLLLSLTEKKPGVSEEEIIKAKRRLAACIDDESEDDKLIRVNLCNDILNFCRAHFVEDSPEVLEALEFLSKAYKKAGDKDNFLAILAEIADIKAQKIGAPHEEAIRIKGDLAREFYEYGEYDKAINLYKELIELQKKNREEYSSVGLNVDWLALEMDCLKEILEELGREKELYDLRKQVVEKEMERLAYCRLYGIYDLRVLYDVLIFLRKYGIYDKAHFYGIYEVVHDYLLEFVDFYQKDDSSSDDTISAMKCLADFCYDNGEEKEALEIRKQAAEINFNHLNAEINRLGENNPYLIECYENARRNFERIADKKNADAMIEKIIPLRRLLAEKLRLELDETHADFIGELENLIRSLEECGRFDEARKEYRELLEVLQKKYQQDNDIADFNSHLSSIANSFIQMENYEEALKIYRKCFELSEIEEDYYAEYRSLRGIITVLIRTGDYESAIREQENLIHLQPPQDDFWNHDKSEQPEKFDERLYLGVLLSIGGYSDKGLAIFMELYNEFKSEDAVPDELMGSIVRVLEENQQYSQSVIWLQKLAERNKEYFFQLIDTLDKLNRHDEATALLSDILEKINNRLEELIEVYGEDSPYAKQQRERIDEINNILSNAGFEFNIV